MVSETSPLIEQTQDAQAVVIIGASYGAIGETHDFGVSLGPKSLLWMPSAARRGYTDNGIRDGIEAAGGRIVYFTPEDIPACSIALASVEFVNRKRMLQALIDGQIEALTKAAPIRPKEM